MLLSSYSDASQNLKICRLNQFINNVLTFSLSLKKITENHHQQKKNKTNTDLYEVFIVQ